MHGMKDYHHEGKILRSLVKKKNVFLNKKYTKTLVFSLRVTVNNPMWQVPRTSSSSKRNKRLINSNRSHLRTSGFLHTQTKESPQHQSFKKI